MVAQIDQGGMYLRLKELQRQLEILEIQEEYIRDETKNLKREMIRAKVCFFDSSVHF
jgi:26S proteasome regulatory subunit T3